jgi:glycosyltransferase involved in cell wall biosynthesis
MIKRKEIREKLNLQNFHIIGHVGNFTLPKNHEFLIDVFKKLISKHNDYKLVLVGDGPMMDEIKRKVFRLDLKERVIFLGSRSDVNNLLQAMDVFVFPSRFEGFGMAAMEAQAAGLPCIISDKVPGACIVTDRVKRVSLDESLDSWANEIIEAATHTRYDVYEKIKNCGFDITTNSRLLEQFYVRGGTENAFTNNIYSSL